MSADVDAAREALLAEAAENGVWLEFTAALDAFEAAIRAEYEEHDVFEHPSLGVAEMYKGGPPPSHYTATPAEEER